VTRPLRWLRPKHGIILLVVTALGAVGIVANHIASQRRFLLQFEEALPLSIALSADALRDWVTMREAQAEMVATLAGEREWTGANINSARALSAPLAVMKRAGGYRSAEIVTGDAAPPHLASGHIDDSLSTIAFVAPVTREGAPPASVVLTVVATEATFSQFNVAAPSDRTQRTSLIALDGDRVRVIVVSGAGGAPQLSRRTASVPSTFTLDSAYARALRTTGLRAARGVGAGITGSQVVYARAPIAGTPWLLVRERDTNELASLIQSSLIITDVVFSVVLALALGVMMMLWRATFLRRENESAQLRSTFVSSVSHELRTPLTQIRMYAEMLRLGLLTTPEESARALSVIEKESERLTMLVERSLSYTRTGVRPSDHAPPVVDVAEAVTRATGSLALLAAEREATFDVTVDNGCCACIERDALHQVLLNLLDNAIKYGPRGQTIRVTASTRDTTTRLAVEDEGAGVPVHERHEIWKAFTRGTQAKHGGEVGSGIGLAVVRDLVEAAGGRAFVESRAPNAHPSSDVPSGARFVVELPSQSLSAAS